MHRKISSGLALAAFLLSSSQVLAGDAYVYQRSGFGSAGALSVELESAVGTREARPFGEEGIEGGMRLRYRPTDRVSVEGWGAVLLEGGEYRNEAFSLEANLGVLKQDRHFINLSVGGGVKRDFVDVVVPQVRVTANRTWESLDLTLAGIAEKPLAEGRDVVDVIVGAAASYEVARGLRLGGELIGEDLEGFWEEEEAEGGAKLVAGPTVWWGPGEHVGIKLNAAAVVAATRNPTPAGEPAPDVSTGPGFLGRLVVGYVF